VCSISAKRVILLDALHRDRLRHTGAANPITTLEQGDLVSSTHQVVGRDQAVDTGPDDGDVLWGFCHWNKISFPPDCEKACNLRFGAFFG